MIHGPANSRYHLYVKIQNIHIKIQNPEDNIRCEGEVPDLCPNLWTDKHGGLGQIHSQTYKHVNEYEEMDSELSGFISSY